MLKKYLPYGVSILIALGVGFLSSLLSMDGMEEYAALAHPPLSPPGKLFPIVWTVLFILMGISSGIVYTSDDPDRGTALTAYSMQLFVNFLWPILFFAMGMYLAAFFWLLLLIALVIWMIVRFYAVKPIAAYMQIPYLLWLLFASYLNFGVWYLNR